MEKEETLIFSNAIGSVTSKKIILKHKQKRAVIPINQINLVGYHHQRSYLWAIGSFATAILMIAIMAMINGVSNNVALLMGIIIILILLLAVYNWIGYHVIMIHSDEEEIKSFKIKLFRMNEGRRFANAIKHIVIHTTSNLNLNNRLFVL